MPLALIFTLGPEIYGLEIDAIQEIIESPAVHYVPRATGVITGAINFHGQVLALIDLPQLLGFCGQERDHRHVVLTPEFKSLVLTVSSIDRIDKLDLSSLQPPPAESEGRAVRGVVTLNEMTVNLLDTDVIINQLENRFTE